MKTSLEALEATGKRSKVKVIVGGAPVTEDFTHQIGADASKAVAVTKSLISSSD